jgi:hypothetical protein
MVIEFDVVQIDQIVLDVGGFRAAVTRRLFSRSLFSISLLTTLAPSAGGGVFNAARLACGFVFDNPSTEVEIIIRGRFVYRDRRFDGRGRGVFFTGLTCRGAAGARRR